jgi:hypothetical protein
MILIMRMMTLHYYLVTKYLIKNISIQTYIPLQFYHNDLNHQ